MPGSNHSEAVPIKVSVKLATAMVAVVSVKKAESESTERANTRNVRRRAELKTMIDARRALAEQYAVIFASMCKP